MELIISFIFEYLSYRIGVALVALITFGKVRPKPQSNPFYFSFVGIIFIIAFVGMLIYFVKLNG